MVINVAFQDRQLKIAGNLFHREWDFFQAVIDGGVDFLFAFKPVTDVYGIPLSHTGNDGLEGFRIGFGRMFKAVLQQPVHNEFPVKSGGCENTDPLRCVPPNS